MMRAMINRSNTKEDVDDLLKRVDEIVGEDAGLRGQAVGGFQRLLSTTYGTEYARKRFQEYVKKHGKAQRPKKRL